VIGRTAKIFLISKRTFLISNLYAVGKSDYGSHITNHTNSRRIHSLFPLRADSWQKNNARLIVGEKQAIFERERGQSRLFIPTNNFYPRGFQRLARLVERSDHHRITKQNMVRHYPEGVTSIQWKNQTSGEIRTTQLSIRFLKFPSSDFRASVKSPGGITPNVLRIGREKDNYWFA